jgi:hypothetical protein
MLSFHKQLRQGCASAWMLGIGERSDTVLPTASRA